VVLRKLYRIILRRRSKADPTKSGGRLEEVSSGPSAHLSEFGELVRKETGWIVPAFVKNLGYELSRSRRAATTAPSASCPANEADDDLLTEAHRAQLEKVAARSQEQYGDYHDKKASTGHPTRGRSRSRPRRRCRHLPWPCSCAATSPVLGSVQEQVRTSVACHLPIDTQGTRYMLSYVLRLISGKTR
jgi:hypothetical protein